MTDIPVFDQGCKTILGYLDSSVIHTPALRDFTMTELEQARAHLRISQLNLFEIRRVHKGSQPWLDQAKQRVLAALSWVWDAQERDLGWQVYLQVKRGIEEMARAFNEGGAEPTRLHIPLPNALKLGLITAAEARRALRRQPGFLPRPTRRAAAPASRGRRRR